jgi:hypothetical protein
MEKDNTVLQLDAEERPMILEVMSMPESQSEDEEGQILTLLDAWGLENLRIIINDGLTFMRRRRQGVLSAGVYIRSPRTRTGLKPMIRYNSSATPISVQARQTNPQRLEGVHSRV